MNAELKKAKDGYEKYFFKQINKRRNYLVPKPNCHAEKFFMENMLAIKMKESQILISKYFYLGLPILELSKNVIYEFLYDYLKLKYG